MKKKSILIMILMMALRFAIAQQGGNLVRNGTFEEGNVGFKSDFRFDSHLIRSDTLSSLYDNGQYLVIDHFPHSYVKNDFHDMVSWTYRVQCVDPEGSSSGFFLAVGVNSANFPSKGKQRLWYDSITIKPNTTYVFSCMVANIWYKPNRTNVGAIKLCVNEKKVSRVLNLPYSNEWKILCGKFTSGPDQTGVEVSIQDWNLSSSWGDKVAVDNIVFKEIQPGEFAKKEEPVVETPPVKEEESVKVKEEPVLVKDDTVVVKEEPVAEKEEPVITPKKKTSPPPVKEEVLLTPPKKIIISPPQVKKVKSEKKRIPLPVEKKPVLIVKEEKKKVEEKKQTPSVKNEEPQFATKVEAFHKSMTVHLGQKLELKHIQFERSKSALLPEAVPQLNDLVTFMINNPTVRIRLEGHTDTHGKPEANLELSENRVKEVKKYLVEKGIADNRIECVGYGGTKPLNSDRIEALSKLNRRVEVVIIGK